MLHVMNLNEKPYNSIKYEKKDIELRLNDEKRKKIAIGDFIIFKNLQNDEQLKTIVINIYQYSNFEELYDNFDKVRLGYEVTEVASPSDMEAYYSKEQIEKYGVLGIEIQKI